MNDFQTPTGGTGDNEPDSIFSEINLRDIYLVLFRHLKLLLLVFVVSVCLSVLYTVRMQDMYMAKTSLLIRAGRESIDIIPTVDNDRLVSLTRSAAQDMNNEVEILRSHELYEKLVASIGLDSFLDENVDMAILTEDERNAISENVIDSMMENIAIEVRQNSNVISISYTARSPELAHQVLRTLIDLFYEKHMAVHYSSSSFDFFKNQLKKTRDTLATIDDQIIQVKNQLDIESIDRHLVALSDLIATTNLRLSDNALQRAKLKVQIEALESSHETATDPGRLPRSNIDGPFFNTELSNLIMREQELLSKYSEENYQVTEVRRQIAALRQQAQDGQPEIGTNGDSARRLTDLTMELQALQVENYELGRYLSRAKENLKNANVIKLTLDRLERERDINQANYIKYSDNMEEARIDQIVQQEKLSNITVVQPVTYPRQPIRNRKLRSIAMGVFVGIFGGIFIAVVLEYFDHSLKTEEDIRRNLQLKTLAVIPKKTAS